MLTENEIISCKLAQFIYVYIEKKFYIKHILQSVMCILTIGICVQFQFLFYIISLINHITAEY